MKHEDAGKTYCPSNGSEGDWFIDKYCMNCINCDPDPDGEKQCMILCNSMCYSPNEEGFPKEWVYDDEGNPSCTAYVKWDWGRDGNPDDPDNPKAPVPDDPMQLCLPFAVNDILQDHQVKETA